MISYVVYLFFGVVLGPIFVEVLKEIIISINILTDYFENIFKYCMEIIIAILLILITRVY